MDIHTLLTVRDMHNDEDVDFGKWLSVAIEQLEVIEDARYQEKLSKRKIQEVNHVYRSKIMVVFC